MDEASLNATWVNQRILKENKSAKYLDYLGESILCAVSGQELLDNARGSFGFLSFLSSQLPLERPTMPVGLGQLRGRSERE